MAIVTGWWDDVAHFYLRWIFLSLVPAPIAGPEVVMICCPGSTP
jgi:hypothetical protein